MKRTTTSIGLTLWLGITFTVGCGGGSTTSQTASTNYDPAALDAFWRELIAAVESDDPEQVAALSDFPLDLLTGEVGKADSISREQLINDYYPSYFQHPLWRAALLNADLSTVKIAGTGFALPLYIEVASGDKPSRQSATWTIYARRMPTGEYRLGGMSFLR